MARASLPSHLLLALATVLLCACGASSPALRAWEEAGAASCERDDADACVALACDEEACGLFDCEDVESEAMAVAPPPPTPTPRVELAQAYRAPWRPPAFRN